MTPNDLIRLAAFAETWEPPFDWHAAVVEVPGAIVAPLDRYRRLAALHGHVRDVLRVHNGGVYRADGTIVPEGLHRGPFRSLPDDLTPGLVPDRLAGRWLFGGYAHLHHLGHLATESLGRLWALEERGPFDGVVFIDRLFWPTAEADSRIPEAVRRHRQQNAASHGASWDLLRLCGVPAAVHLVGVRAAQVERLVVPTPLMGLLPGPSLIGGHPLWRAWLRRRMTVLDGMAPGLPRRLYVSRGGLPARKGGFLEEAVLERAFAAAGYGILRPETMPKPLELAAYRHASHVVLAAGTAAHLLALALDGRQQVALLSRHPGSLPRFATQLRLMGAAAVHELAMLAGTFQRADAATGAALPWPAGRRIHSLDVAALWDRLAALGFVGNPLPEEDPAEQPGRIAAMAARLAAAWPGSRFAFQPFPALRG